MDSQTQHIRNDGTGYKYFTIVPNMDIDDLPPLALALLIHYRRICGPQGGTVTESLRETAEKTQMSKSQVARVRAALAERGCIAVIHDPDNPRAPVTVRVLDKWGENMARYSATAPPPSSSAAQQPPAEKVQNSGVPEVDTAEEVSPSGPDVSLTGTGCPQQGQGCPSQGHAPYIEKLKKQDQEPDQEPAAVSIPGKPARARASDTPKTAAAAAESKSSAPEKEIPEKAGAGGVQVQGEHTQAANAEKAPSDVLGALVAEAAGLDGVNASRALAAYADNIAPLVPITAQKVRDLVQEYGEEAVLMAIREAVTHNARKLAYIEAVLRRLGGKAKPQDVKLRARAIAWVREQGEDVQDGADGRELWAALVAAAEFDPRFVPEEFRRLNAAVSR